MKLNKKASSQMALVLLALNGNWVRSQTVVEWTACREQVQRLCSDRKSLSDVLHCMREQHKDLSVECKQELERQGLLQRQMSQRSGGSPGGGGGMNPFSPPVPMASYEGRGMWKSPAFSEHKLSAGLPILTTPKDRGGVSALAGQTRLGEQVRLSNGVLLPQTLYRAELGGQYLHLGSEKRNWSLRGSYGAAGDKLEKATSFSVIGSYGFPRGDSGYWVAILYFSNNSPLGNYVPIPGIMYIYRTEKFTGMFGLPVLMMQWTPVNPWSMGLSVFGPTLNAEAVYGEVDSVQVFTSLAWTRQSFILSERRRDKDRLILEESKAALGLRIPGWMLSRLELQAGYAFGRSVFVGQGFSNKEGGSARLPDDWFLSGSIKFFF